MFRFLFVLYTFFFIIRSHSQTVISGLVQDSTKTGIQFCSLALFNAKDSTIFKGNSTNDKGEFRFENIPSSSYFIKISYIGYIDLISKVFRVDSQDEIILPPFRLQTEGISMNEISVKTFRKTVSFENGKVILNVENDIMSAGNFVIELLRRLPGVSIDAQNNIIVNGKQGVKFLIDGRLQQFPTSQMIQILSNMSSESISKIELIKNPPAKYDASGIGGLINIVSKKSKLTGFNGSITNSTSKGKGIGEMNNVSLNYKSNKLSVFGNVMGSYRDYKNSMILDRSFLQDSSNSTLNLSGKEEIFVSTLNFKAGIQYDYSSKTIVGINLDGGAVVFHTAGNTHSSIFETSMLNYTDLNVITSNNEKYFTPTINVNCNHLLDTMGSQITISADFLNYQNNRMNSNINYFSDSFKIENPPTFEYKNENKMNFNIATQKLDYIKVFSNSSRLEGGFKSSFVSNDCLSKVQNNEEKQTVFKIDPRFTTNMIYKEQIIAGYIDFVKIFKKYTMETGLRAEQTLIQMQNFSSGLNLSRNYINFFPNFSFDYKQNEKNNYHFSYSYRLDRPDYEQLNPTYTFNNRLNYGVGNPYLIPQYSHNFELELNHNDFITNSLSFMSMKNGIYNYSYTKDGSGISIDTVINFALKQMFSYNVFVQKQFYSFYRMQLNSIVTYMDYVGKINDFEVRSNRIAFKGTLNNEFSLPKEVKLQIFVSYASPYKDGFQNYSPQYSMNLAVQKRFFKNQLNVVLGFSDIFYTDYSSVSSNLPNQYYFSLTKNDTRRIRINLTYKFGKIKIENKIQDKKAEDVIRIKKL